MRTTQHTVRGLPTPVLEGGPADAEEAVVFVHGNPGSGRDWEDLAGRVGEFARVVAPDLPGFGKGARAKDFPYTVPGYSDFLGATLTELGVRRAHLVLHDFGGPWGLHWAAEHPDAFASATLVNTGLLLRFKWHRLARIWRTPGLGEAFQATTTKAGLKWLINRENPSPLPDAFLDRMYADIDAGTKRAVLKLYRATSDPAGDSARIAPVFRELRRPALVVWGAADPYIPVEHAERQREGFPGAKVVTLPNSGHWPMADDPEGLAEIVVPFLREQTAAA